MTMTMASRAHARPTAAWATPVRPPNRLAQKITGRDYLSYSQLSTMRACPRKFAFQYTENVPQDFVSSSLIFGGSIHAALERFYRCRLEGVAVTHEALLSAWAGHWQQQCRQALDVPVRFSKAESYESLHALAGRTLAAFLASPLAEPKGEILGIEEQLRVVLDPDLPDVLARTDLVTRTRGVLHVIDFKTSRSRWTGQKAVESAEQLVLYGVSVATLSEYLGAAVKLHYAVITKGKNPQVQVLPVPTDPARVAVTTRSVAELWQAIQAGNFYPAPSPMNCSTCPYRSRCPIFAGA